MLDAFTRLTPLDLAFIVAVLLALHVARRWIPLYALLVWPGTALHELSHWLVATLTGGRPTALRLWPVRSERGWRLGSVSVANVRWFNAVPIGFAPLLLAPLALVALMQATRAGGAPAWHWTMLYLATAAAVCCLPSVTDLKLVLSRPLGLLAYLAAAAAVVAFVFLR